MQYIKVGYSHCDNEYESVDLIIGAPEDLFEFVKSQVKEQYGINISEYQAVELSHGDTENPYITNYSTGNILITINPHHIPDGMLDWLEDQGFDIEIHYGLETEEQVEIRIELESVFNQD